MSARIANISMMHQACLAGLEAGIRDSLGINSKDYHDSLIYSAMIQAGVQRFRIVGPINKRIKKSQFLSKRCEEYPFADYKRLMDSVEDTLIQHKVTHKESDSENTDIFNLTWFLTELIFSLQTKSAMVNILPIPNISDYAGKLSPEMLASIMYLLQNIEPYPLDLPIPQLQVLHKDVKVFHDVISSDLFSEYASSQQLLESLEEEKESTTRLIMNRGKALIKRFSSVLDCRRILVSLIPVTSSLIDTVCGKLPGSLADSFGVALTEALNSKRRVTIYNYGYTHKKLLMDHYLSGEINKGKKPQQVNPAESQGGTRVPS